jgi:HPt (histidine-containing phosphotransfer) domain-containing protein
MLASLASYLGGERVMARVAEEAGPLPTLTVSVATPALLPAAAPMARPRGEPVHSRLAMHPRLARVARSFCEQLPNKLDEMQRALSAGDFPALSALAHWLKGAGGTVGYDAFFEPARDLEHAAVAADAAAAHVEMERLNQLALRVVPPPESASTARPSPSATTMAVEEVVTA